MQKLICAAWFVYATSMRTLHVLLSSAVVWFFRRISFAFICLVSVMLALTPVGCGSIVGAKAPSIPSELVREVCWAPPGVGIEQYFVFRFLSSTPTVGDEIARGELIFRYTEQGPVKNVRLIP